VLAAALLVLSDIHCIIDGAGYGRWIVVVVVVLLDVLAHCRRRYDVVGAVALLNACRFALRHAAFHLVDGIRELWRRSTRRSLAW